MKLGKRLGLVAAIAALSLAPMIGSLAQGMTCTLSAADCQTLTTANTNIAKETSFAFSYEFKADIKGDSPVTGDSTGSGQFSITAPATMTDPTAWANAIQFSIDSKGSGSGGGSSGSGSLSVVVTGGVAYFKTSSQDWQGVNLADAIKMGQAQAAGGGGFGGSSSMNPAQMQQMLSNPDIMKALASLQNIKGFITQEKTSNTPQVEGQNMSEFVETLSPAALLNSPDFATALKSIVTAVMAANPNAGAAGSANMDQMTAMMPMFGAMLGNTNLKVTTWVGQTDNMYHAFGLDLNLNVNTAAMGGSSTPTTGTIHFLVQLTKVGQAVTVTAPTGAKMINLSGMSGMSGGGVMPSVATPTASS